MIFPWQNKAWGELGRYRAQLLHAILLREREGLGGEALARTFAQSLLCETPQAGGLPEVFTTAHDALFTQAGLGMGERVLVHGAAGGVGTAAVQLAAAAGARVTATVRKADRPHRHR